jgi:purine-binding chemotaxis protein CheW
MTSLQKYQEPTLVSDEATLHVLFQVAGAEYVLPSDTVLQMESFTGATPVPGAPPFVAGIVQVRGRVVPVVDLRLRFGHPVAALSLDNRVIIGQHADRVVGLLVDSAREVVKLSPSQMKPPPPILGYHASGFVKAVAQLGARLVMLVDFAKVIGEELADVVE